MITGMFNKFNCLIGRHLEGRKDSCPFTLYTYISCIHCNKTIGIESTYPDPYDVYRYLYKGIKPTKK